MTRTPERDRAELLHTLMVIGAELGQMVSLDGVHNGNVAASLTSEIHRRATEYMRKQASLTLCLSELAQLRSELCDVRAELAAAREGAKG